MSKKQEEKSKESRQKLLSAAESLFHEKNINEVGVREIAAKAGMTTGNFYYHFKGKADILNQLYLDRDEEFGVIIDAYLGTPPYKDKILYFFAEDLAARVEEDGVDFTFHRMFQLKKHSMKNHILYQSVERLIEKAVENKEISDEKDIAKLTEYLFVVFRGIVYEWCLNKEESLKDLTLEMMKMALDGIGFQS